MILRPVSPVSPLGPPTTNFPVGLMWKMISSSHSLRGTTGLIDQLDDLPLGFFADGVGLLVQDRFIVLGGDDDGVNARRPLVHVFDRDLALAVGPEPGELSLESHLGQAFDDAMGQMDGQRHQLVGFVAGVSEHQALIAGALFLGIILGMIDAAGDVGGLGMDGRQHAAALVIETDFGMVVTDLADGVAGHLGGVNPRVGGHFAGHHDLAGGHQRFAGHPATGVLGEDGVEHGIADLVGHLIGMAHGDGFAGEQMAAAAEFGGHSFSPFRSFGTKK